MAALWPLGVHAAEDNARRVQINPETGEIVTPSAPTAPQSAAGETDQPSAGSQSDSQRGARAWTTDDGVQMVTPDPEDAPTTQATACPDGSLHIGQARPPTGRGAQQPSCAEDDH